MPTNAFRRQSFSVAENYVFYDFCADLTPCGDEAPSHNNQNGTPTPRERRRGEGHAGGPARRRLVLVQTTTIPTLSHPLRIVSECFPIGILCVELGEYNI